MTSLTLIYIGLYYFAAIVLIGGVAYRIAEYSRTPAPLKIPTTPAPTTTGGVVLRMAREVVLFESLFKSNKWIWVFGWMFHVGLALVLLRSTLHTDGEASRSFISAADDKQLIGFVQQFQLRQVVLVGIFQGRDENQAGVRDDARQFAEPAELLFMGQRGGLVRLSQTF